MSIRVVIAEPRAAARAALSLLLASDPGIEVMGDAANGDEAVALVAATSPDIALLEVRLSGMSGLEAIARITARTAPQHTRVLAYSNYTEDEDEFLFPALSSGASGFLAVETEPQVVLSAIRALARGDSWLGPRHTRRLITEYVSRTGPRPPAAAGGVRSLTSLLSAREREVTALIGEGCTNGEIAERLCLSPLTAKKYVSRLMAKLGARDRVQLALIASHANTSLAS
ncbi:LuxR C-terminal-related transcriptional regulator [Streptomyces sp. NPDC014894]|uniref:LuxR C-terminal-related transcriptional regulator n=1 Tax=unclassified Streptomyces TaxID=2593676 RepID=UPI0036F8DE94